FWSSRAGLRPCPPRTQHEIRIAAGKSGNDAEYGAVFTDIGHDGFLPENVSVGEGAVIGLGIPEFFERRHVDEIVLPRIESPEAAMADAGKRREGSRPHENRDAESTAR